MEKLSMCRICLVEDVRMCVVTNKSLQQMYEKLTDVPFVTEDRKPMLACLFCCTRLQQCCQLQRKCVEAEQLLAHMLREDYEQKPLTNRAHLGCVGGFITTPIENISIVDDCQTASDAVKQELPAVCEEQNVVELLPPRNREELDPDNLYNSHPHVEAHHSECESEEEQLVMEIKVEEERISEKLPARETEKLELKIPDRRDPSIEDTPAQSSESHSEDDVPLVEMKTEAEDGEGVSKRKRRAGVTRKTAVAKKPTLTRKLEDPAKRTLKTIRKTKTGPSESVAKIKEPVTATSQSSFKKSSYIIHTDGKLYKCEVCQRRFSRKDHLKLHCMLHTGEKPYKCDVCQRSFSRKDSLKSHRLQHTGEKPYKCEVCQRSFSRKHYLKLHIMQHTREKPYKCDVCQRSFRWKHYLKSHIMQHTGEKPYKCDVCQRSFNRKHNLKLHIMKHTGEKPYKCDLCQFSFSGKGNLKSHILKHTDEKPYKCDVCQCSFSRKGSLTLHSRRHTGVKP